MVLGVVAEFVAVGERDPVIGRLQAAAPGLRPPLFYSPYEAAAWCVLSARRPPRQMMAVRDRLNQAHGVTFDLAGERLAAFPSPRQLLEVTEFDGLPEVKLTRLHGVARAALDGLLARDRLAGSLGISVQAADGPAGTRFPDRAALLEQTWDRQLPPLASLLCVLRESNLGGYRT